MPTVRVQKDFTAPVERLYEHLAEHEHLGDLFGIRVERVRDGETERNGVGSRRRLSFFGALPFEETVTVAVPNELIEYEITKGSPLRDHHGKMAFAALSSGGSHLDYTITFGAAVPGLAPVVARGLTLGITRGLNKLATTL